MPKIFEYLGILIFFYSNEHEPIHVHAKKGGLEPLTGKHLKSFKCFLNFYANQIVEKWINYFVYHKNVEFEKITKKLK